MSPTVYNAARDAIVLLTVSLAIGYGASALLKWLGFRA